MCDLIIEFINKYEILLTNIRHNNRCRRKLPTPTVQSIYKTITPTTTQTNNEQNQLPSEFYQ